MKAFRIFLLGLAAGFSGAAGVQCGGTRESAVGRTETAPPREAAATVPVSSASAGATAAAPTPLASGVELVTDALETSEPALLRLGHTFTRRHPEAQHTWRLVDGKFWQAESAAGAPAEEPEPGSRCPAGMQLASGEYLLDSAGHDTEAIREWQDQSCVKWRAKSQVCERFDEKRWAAFRKRGKHRTMNVCVDTYEYPNQKDEYPLVVVSHTEATALCKKQKKRLCTESEWTFACEGPDALPYPYGYTRSAKACTIDVTTVPLADDALWPRNTERAVRGIDKAFHATPSGAKADCTSPFGVHDLTGNLDEWTQTTRPGSGYASILKGGFWSKVRARCRPQTRAHGPVFVTYETGFRCCSDPAP